MKHIGLYLRLYPSYLVILLAGFALVAVPSSWILVKSHENQILEQLGPQASLIKKMIPEHISAWNYHEFERLFKDCAFRLTVILKDGTVYYDNRRDSASMENHLNRPEVQNMLSGQRPFALRYSTTLRMKMLYFVQQSPEGSMLRLAHPVDAIYSTINGYLLKIFLTTLVVAIFAAFVSFYMGQRLTRPLKLLEKKALGLTQYFIDGQSSPAMDINTILGESVEFKTMEFQQLSLALDHMARQLVREMDHQREQFQRHQILLKSMVEGVLSVDMNGIILSYNQAAVHMFRLPDDDSLVGKSVKLYLRNPVIIGAMREVMESGLQNVKEFQIFNSIEQSFEVKSVPLKANDGKQVGVVLVGQDLTGTRALSKMRKDFVANVSHELKTPITAIKGFVETLLSEDGQDDVQRKEFLKIVLRQSDRMAAIVEDLLSLSRLEWNKKDFNLNVLDLKPIMEEAILSCKNQAQRKNIELVLQIETGIHVKADCALLEQALVNLLDNAIKYSPEETKVTVSLTAEPKPGGDMCRIDVSDEGEGIAPEYHDRVFERFFRVDRARSKKAGGTGLGLAIVKHIVELHSGKVKLKSKRRQGSTFSIHLPIAQASGQD